MSTEQILAEIDAILARLVAAGWKERDKVKEELLAFVLGSESRNDLETHLDSVRKGYPLEVRWEIEEVLEIIRPEPEPEAEAEAEPETVEEVAPDDMSVIYDDPRGLVIQRSGDGSRYHVTQRDPYSGQPQTVEVPSAQFEQIKSQLSGSPYWVLGAGAGA